MSMVPPSENLLTIREAAQLLRCSERTIRRQIKAGTLPGLIVVGMRCYRINKTVLLEGQRVAS